MTRISDEAVIDKTGRSWDQWFEILDGEGARELDHATIARNLSERHGLTAWWAQSVTVAFEKSRGLRADHQGCEGDYAVSASKTLTVPAETAFNAFHDEGERAAWLPVQGLRVRTATLPKSVRFDWTNGASRVNVHLSEKGAGKTQVSLEHEKLSDAAEAEQMKAFWRERLAQLKTHLEAAR